MASPPTPSPVIDRNIRFRQEVNQRRQLLPALLIQLKEFIRFDRGLINIGVDSLYDDYGLEQLLAELHDDPKLGSLAQRCRLITPDKEGGAFSLQAVIGKVSYHEAAKDNEPLLLCTFYPRAQLDGFCVAVGVLPNNGAFPQSINVDRVDVPWLTRSIRRLLVGGII